ncbi:uncharacterized protein LOC143869757 [Tasmannia lanceolata]|uniref:uncharacterized protein LOC143869757 n=1 Tax=Tasmannia lanceolata TaxID=3420 RepID=UPI0040635E77
MGHPKALALFVITKDLPHISYVTQKYVKGRIIVEQLADVLTEHTELSHEFLDEGIMTIKDAPNDTTWTMYFDGVSNSRGRGVGIVLISPRDEHILISIKLEFVYTNNMAEYEAYIAGFEATLLFEVQDLDVYGDSLLIICQTNEKWLTKEDRLIPYHTYLTSLTKSFHNISFTYISILRNRFADALVIKRHVIPAHVHMVQIATRCSDGKPWYFDIKNLISGRGHPPEASLKEKRALQKLTSRYVISGGDLYRRSFDGVQLLCVNADRAAEILEDAHSGVCDLHMNGKMFARKNFTHSHLRGLSQSGVMTSLAKSPLSPPVDMSTYLLKLITSPSGSKHNRTLRYLIRANIIYRYGVPHVLISDNGSHFNKEVASLCEEFRIKHHKSSPYRPQTNSDVEAANKNIQTILRKMTRSYRDWSSKLPFALWAYITYVRTSTGATLYSLTYGMEAFLPIELKILSFRILMESNLPKFEWACIRHQELCMMDEKRLKAAVDTPF